MTPRASTAPAARAAVTARPKDKSTNSKTDLYPAFVQDSVTSLL